ncbi:hypothetical protein [Dietzia cinnamea]|uniref:hypothetical protein n=1 Tax=Dietzia cinnamea TaxID=321318 RepID=UPI0021A675F3|nr:hypothetical protein [Dietzia cinnamea]MCT1713178.1 hypothetical protein [Dietzia cinnamea]MCT2275298.1 hypothetical protein [Dietzia cinnamea]
MADRPTKGDDDETPRLPEVTVPPWLRTGPGPDSSLPGVPAVDRSADVAGGAGASRAGGRADEPAREAPPTRITLGAGAGEGAAAGSGPGRMADADVDDLSTLPLGTAAAEVRAPVDEPPRSPAVLDRRPARIALLAAAGVAVLGGSAVLGFVVTRGAVNPSGKAVTGCGEVSEPGRVVGAGPGSLDTPAGAVLAFDHAYYVARSAEQAFEAVSPSSRMTEEQLRVEGVERVPEGTTHCVEARQLSPTLLEVDLTEYPPEADPVLIRQRVRLAENPDGTWGIVSITPAG